MADHQIGELSLYLERQKEAVSLFLQEICTLPQLLHDLKTATEQIGEYMLTK
jgi:dsDNA-binding SOS-regulon protein